MTKSENMFELVDQWKQSGKSQKAFCEQMDLKVATFAYWIAKKKRSGQTRDGFALVDVSGEVNQQMEITYPNGVKLTTSQGDLSLISRLIKLY